MKVTAMQSFVAAAAVLGGCCATDVELEWTHFSPMPVPASDHTATTIGDFIYLVGGCVQDQEIYCDSVTDVAYKFDPATGSYTQLDNAPRQRYRHAAVAVGDTLFLFGGRTVADALIPEIDTYDTTTDTWSTSSTTWADATSDLGAFVLDDSTVVLAGGYDAEYNTLTRLQVLDASSATPTWIQTSTQDAEDGKYGDLTTPRGDFAAVLVGDAAYAFGGWNEDFCSALSSTEKFDVSNRTWSTVESSLVLGRGDKAFGVVQNTIYALGGETKDDECGEVSVPVQDVEVFSVEDQEWSVATDLPEHRFRFPAATYGDAIYTFGGQEYYNDTCSCYRISGDVAAIEVTQPDPDATDSASGAHLALFAAALAFVARP